MKTRIITMAVAAVIASWAPLSSAREAVALPGVVGTEGELNGVDTSGSGTLTVNNNQNINTNNDLGGALTSTAAATGSVLFLGSSTVTGFTGTSGAEFLNISAGANGATVNFNGAVFSTTFNISGTGIVNFNGDVITAPVFAGDGFINLGAGRSLTGAITTNTANTGTLTLNGGSSVTGAIGGASGLKQINLGSGNATVTGAVQTLGFGLGIDTLTITGALTTNAGGTISTTLASDSVFGRVIVDTSNINGGGITVIPTVTGALTNGTNFRIVDAPAGTSGAPVFVINNNPRFTFSGVPTTTGDVNILLTGVAPLASLVTTAGALAVAPLLDTNAPAGSDLRTVQDAIAVLPNTAAIDNALAQLAPGNTNLAAPWVASQATRQFEELWMARIDQIHSVCCDTACDPNKPTGSNSVRDCKGDEQHSNWWVKGFGSYAYQDDYKSRNGYDTEAFGLMLAYDVPLNENTRVGLGGGYANSTIDGNNASGRTRVESYQATTYLHYAPGPWFVQAALTAGIDDYDGSRNIVFPGVNREAKSDYRGQQYTGLLSLGRHFQVNETTITPLVSLQASHIRVESYRERGAGDVGLRVESQDYDFIQSTLGVKAERVIRSGSTTYSPEIHAKWLHDFNSTTMEQDASFLGGGGRFSAQGIKQDRDLYNIGAGLTFLSCNCDKNSWTVKGLYDYRWNNSEYYSHQVSIIAGFKF